MNPDLILYDFDGTMYQNDERFKQHFMERAREFAQERGFDESVIADGSEAVKLGFYNSTADYLVDHGLIDHESQFKEFVFDEIPGDVVDLQASKTIKELQLEYDSGIFTNNSRDAVEAYIDESGLEGCFDIVITHEDLSELKPHELAFQEAFTRLTHQDIVFVEDSLENAQEAREYGMTPVYIDRSEDYRGEITSIGSLTKLGEVLE